MPKIKFKRAVLHATSPLIQYGYQFTESHNSHVVEFRKSLIQGVQCQINFQLRQHFVPPIREFTIDLLRERIPDFPERDTLYQWLHIELAHLLKYVYEADIFPQREEPYWELLLKKDLHGLEAYPLGKYAWEFVDQQSLLDQLVKAQPFVLEYGVKWLEDPKSNMDWVNKGRL